MPHDHDSTLERGTDSRPRDTPQTNAITTSTGNSLDTLTPLLGSLAIDTSSTTPNAKYLAETPEREDDAALSTPSPVVEAPSEPRQGLVAKVWPSPKLVESSSAACVLCGMTATIESKIYETLCCQQNACETCLTNAIPDRIQSDIWCHMGSLEWSGCIAGQCSARSRGLDLPLRIVHARFGMITNAQQARVILELVKPQPAQQEWELAQKLHKTLVEHELAYAWDEAPGFDMNSVLMLPVRSGFLTQRVPILKDMLKTTVMRCARCSFDFNAVDTTKNEAAWTYVTTRFPGDWSWMVLGRPSKAVLPQCASKHSLDICADCLPKFAFAALEFVDGIAGGGNYRWACSMCKEILTPNQVEKLARLVDPSRVPRSLSGLSISSNLPQGLAAKPAALPSSLSSMFGRTNKPNLLGGGGSSFGPSPGPSETAAHQAALMNAIVTKKPNVRWRDVAGMSMAKEELQRAIIFPAKFPSLYNGKRKPSNAILLYGPPGTGKSYLAKAVATEVNHTFFSISAADVVSKWMGDSEKLVRNLFTLGRQHAPSIIFLDEIDALCSNREGSGSGGAAGAGGSGNNEHSSRLKTELLLQLDGTMHTDAPAVDGNNQSGELEGKKSEGDGRVVVLAATNLPWLLDPAFRRRFEPRVYVSLPDREARRELFRIHAGVDENSDGDEKGEAGKRGDDEGGGEGSILSDEDLDELADMTDGYSGSDIANAVKNSMGMPVREVQRAKYFRVVSEKGGLLGESGTEQGDDEKYYTPCGPGDEGAIKMGWEDVPENRLRVGPVRAEDFKRVLRNRTVKSSVGAGESQRYEDWTREFGVEGK
ncbi:P-loop containing nucleoside triphosphate hydrolase protein [Chaetomium sp. MPI-SDFR-AT-0129]|nr:P-loop containing nucleoside triphosphate hydrolase protein [Chaetomium sp. MPI-SDFR-AT-0129]